MNQLHVETELEAYICENFLEGDRALTSKTPLLDWGILTSMNTTLLITFIREHFGPSVPPASITATNFRDLDSIARLVVDLHVSERGTAE